MHFWRASLEDPETNQVFGFADFASMVAFLQQQIDDHTPPEHALPAEGGEQRKRD